MQLEFKHLAPYLPYGLKVQFEGIINGKELGDYDKRYKEATKDDMFAEFKEQRPGEIKGLKIGDIKIIEVCKKFTKYRIGGKGKQTHYGTERFKPVFRPLSDLNQEITHNKETFIPVIYIRRMLEKIDGNHRHFGYPLTLDGYSCGNLALPYWIIEKLFEWHFDMFGLIENGLAVNVHCQTARQQ